MPLNTQVTMAGLALNISRQNIPKIHYAGSSLLRRVLRCAAKKSFYAFLRAAQRLRVLRGEFYGFMLVEYCEKSVYHGGHGGKEKREKVRIGLFVGCFRLTL
jgi:hypothetical protein